VGLRPTAAVYGVAVIVLALVAVAGLLRRRRVGQRTRAVEQPEPAAAPL
jgi:branched-subunit amino acid ABC-type transport system permease component